MLGQSWGQADVDILYKVLIIINYFKGFVNMILSKYLKILELFILGFVFPITIVIFRFSEFILLFLWLVSIYAIVLIFLKYRNTLTLKSLFHINFKTNKGYIKFILCRWFFITIILYIFTYYMFPSKLFLIQKNDISLLYKIFIFYPFISAVPQEFIFCTFFFY